MRAPLTVMGLAVAGFGVYGLALDSPFTAYYVPITVVLTGAIWLIHRSARFSPGVIWALVAAAVGNLFGGVFLVGGDVLYSFDLGGGLRYDKPYHALATGVAAWACYQALESWSVRGRWALGFAAVLMASGAGALVEIVEFIGSRIFETTNVGDYANNMLDLAANLAGAVVASVALSAARREG